MIPIPELSASDIVRFCKNFVMCGKDNCWLWTGSQTGKNGPYYKPSFKIKDTNYVAYRVMWRFAYKEDPGEMQVCHECDNPLCVNPSHLWLGTISDNMLDSYVKGRKISSNRREIQDHQVPIIRRLRDQGLTYQKIADKFNVSKSTVYLICTGQRYANL